MSEEIKEFAPIVDMQQSGPKFDPNKKYTWNADAAVTLTGSEFGQILNTLRAITSTKEAQIIILADKAADAVEEVLVRNVNNGNFVEMPDAPKNSL